jgi:hypothetical protein
MGVIYATPTKTPGRPRAIGPLGTTARALVGLALLAGGIIGGGRWIAWWQLAFGVVGLPTVVLAARVAWLALTERPLTQTSHIASCLNCAAVAGLLTVSQTRGGTLVFLGGSMLLAAIRGYGGCETLAISNWLLQRNDQVGCLVLLPVDQLETLGERRSDKRAERSGARDVRSLPFEQLVSGVLTEVAGPSRGR